DVDVARDPLSLFLTKAEIVFRDVTADDRNFVSNKIVERGAVTFSHWIKWLRADHVLPKAGFRLFLRAGADGHIDAADVRKAVHQHGQRRLAQKAGTTD